jgi:hypothetical protein
VNHPDLRAPWRVEGKFDAEVGVTIVNADGSDVCEFYPETGAWSREEIVSARAMAAAPEMLRALDDLVHGRTAVGIGIRVGELVGIRELIAKVKAA